MTRQNALFELIETEREFVQDLETTIRLFIDPLSTLDTIPISRRADFISSVFSNIPILLSVNAKLLRRLLKRRAEKPVIDKIGDIFLNATSEFYPYITYGSQQVFAKSILDHEKMSNPEFATFIQLAERRPEMRKLTLESFLARPTTRLGRYLLLLKQVADKAADNNMDFVVLPQVISSIRDIMSEMNVKVGIADNRLKLTQLNAKIEDGPGERQVIFACCF